MGQKQLMNLNVLLSINPWLSWEYGMSMAQAIPWDSPSSFGMGLSVPLIWGLGDLVAAMGSSQTPRNNL